MALDKARLPSERSNGEHGNGNASAQGATRRKQRAIDRAVQWLLGMQCSNGGWASFDKDNSLKLVAKIPFADFGEIIDPPSVDVTAHVLEMLGQCGYSADNPAVSRALDYILAEQEPDGAWFGRWGVNYIYGIGAALPALQAVGFDMSADCVRRAVQWLAARQNPDGGWGESCASYVDPEFRGKGPSAPSQTAWAIIALLAAGESAHQSTRRGIQFLVERQQPDGSWDEPLLHRHGLSRLPHRRAPRSLPIPRRPRLSGQRTPRRLYDQLSSIQNILAANGARPLSPQC